jgi:hypothetical protein
VKITLLRHYYARHCITTNGIYTFWTRAGLHPPAVMHYNWSAVCLDLRCVVVAFLVLSSSFISSLDLLFSSALVMLLLVLSTVSAGPFSLSDLYLNDTLFYSYAVVLVHNYPMSLSKLPPSIALVEPSW